MSKTIEEKYQKMSHHEHVLEKPDMYIGSINNDESEMYIKEDDKIIKKNIIFNPALYKLYDEALVNARDHTINCKDCNIIKINIDKKKNQITIYNNGDGIPIKIHKEHGIYVPELIFGNLLTSTNYDKDEERITGGKYGLGIKLTNIWSTKFTVETCDGVNEYEQIFEKNMYNKTEPIIKKSKKEQYTKISFIPDLKRLNMKELSDDIMKLFEKRAYDISLCTNKNVKIYFNDELIKIKKLEDYVKLYYENDINIITTTIDNWDIGLIVKENEQDKPLYISFVNSICTYNNGTHMKYVTNQITENITNILETKYKLLNIKPNYIKNNIDIFINAVIVNPDFQSQSKDELTTPIKSYKQKYIIKSNIYEKIINETKLVEYIKELLEIANQKLLKKTNGNINTSGGKNKHIILDIPKLEDALYVLEGKKDPRTIMIFTEGDSAKTFALNGRNVVSEELIGVFPLKGKLLNTRNCTSIDKYLESTELKNINMILGLKHGEKYDNVNKLRYSKILILTDQDVDGAHIKGLFINYINSFWPELLLIEGYINTIATPLIKVYEKSDKMQKNPKEFYSEIEYNDWISDKDITKYQKPQYYKGLGTSSKEEAKALFKNFNNIIVRFIWEKNIIENDVTEMKTTKKIKKSIIVKSTNDLITKSQSYHKLKLAFEKDYTAERKEWLKEYDINNILDYNKRNITYSEFIDKDLKHFSNYDNLRSIPKIIDGLKPCQRKILYVSMMSKINSLERCIKVELLAASVSEKTAYKHGEQSLKEAIIGMGQKYINGNNINLLAPKSEFGTRRLGGKDHGAPRYIFCYLNPLTHLIFRKEDECILKPLIEEGMKIEPEKYYPIIPMILVNGTNGIGTGYSTNIPMYNPKEIIENIKNKIKNGTFIEMNPWYKNFKGDIFKVDKKSFKVYGKYNIINDACVITELPIDVWHDDYKQMIYKKINDDNKIINIKNKCDNDNIYIEIEFNRSDLQALYKSDSIIKYLELSSKINLSNMHLYDTNNKIKKYDSVIEIMEEYYNIRLNAYKDRKKYYIKILQNKLDVIKYRIKFINQILNKEIIIERKNKEYILNELVKNKYPMLKINIENENDDDLLSYDYLIKLPLFVLTLEQIEKYNEDYINHNNELETYKLLKETDIWYKELEELEHEYDKWYKEELNEPNVTKSEKKKKIK